MNLLLIHSTHKQIMKKIISSIIMALVCLSSLADIPSGYYDNAIGKHDEALMTALEGIIYSHTELTYAYMWTAFDYTDVGDDGYYIDMYSNCKYNNQSDHTSGASYVGQGINREHSFPKSWYNSQTPTYTDLFMLVPTDAYVNQQRSNYPYGVCSGGETYTNGNYTMLGKIGTSTYNGYTDKVFEPDDEYKGDFARIYFYIVTCYKSSVSSWKGSGQLDYSSNGYKAFSDWSIQMLMEWHRADPVSDKEKNRQEATYKLQGNRNPFVDHPELAEYIWGTKQGDSWTGDDDDDDDPELTKEVPVIYAADTTAVTSSSFRADWTPVDNVSSYTLYVNRIANGEDTDATLLLSEGFGGVTATSDGSSDISSSLDNYCDVEGWTGYKVYVANGGVKVGTSSAVGYLTSPTLSLGSTVSVVFSAASWVNAKSVSDGSSIVVSCGDVSETVTLTDAAASYTVVLTGCTDSNIKLSTTAGKKRLYLYSVNIYNGDVTASASNMLRAVVEEGDSTTRTISGITDTCYTVQALETGTYEYMVKAIYTDGTASVWSNVEHVTLVDDGSIDTYAPVMLAADSSYITDSSFRAEWTDETSQQLVTSYTLYVAELGSDSYVEVMGITDKYYDVEGLTASTTYQYYVVATYTDGSTAQSNIMTVTLLSDEHTLKGDVNHDGTVNISDVTKLIDRVLAGKSIDSDSDRCCDTCCDVNGDNVINISDVTALIDIVISGD